MWALALSFVRSPAGRAIVSVVAVLILVLAMRSHWIGQGVAKERAAEAARVAQAQKKIDRRTAQAAAITTAVKDDHERRRAEIRTVTQTLVREVPIYVTAKADADCRVPLGFVRLHDAAASGAAPALPTAAGGPVDAASGVALSSVGATVAANYGEALTWRAEAQAWRDWYAREAAAWKSH